MENEIGFQIEKLWEAQGKMEESENGCFSYSDLKSNYILTKLWAPIL